MAIRDVLDIQYRLSLLNGSPVKPSTVLALRRISHRLRLFGEHVCNGEMTYEDYEAKCWPLIVRADRECTDGEIKGVIVYHQTDPRGAALHVIPTKELPKGWNMETVDRMYSSIGVAIY